MGETCGALVIKECIMYASGIAMYIVDGRVTVEFTDVEIAGFDLGNERGYREVGH